MVKSSAKFNRNEFEDWLFPLCPVFERVKTGVYPN